MSMFVENLSDNKSNLIKEAFKENKDSITICNYDFKISDPNYSGGKIESNCKYLPVKEDLNIIDSFDINKLNRLENDVDYLMKLIKIRKQQLNPIKEKARIEIIEFKESNKKMISLEVIKEFYASDTYGDEKLLNWERLGKIKYNNTKQYQDEINNKISELKRQYNIA